MARKSPRKSSRKSSRKLSRKSIQGTGCGTAVATIGKGVLSNTDKFDLCIDTVVKDETGQSMNETGRFIAQMTQYLSRKIEEDKSLVKDVGRMVQILDSYYEDKLLNKLRDGFATIVAKGCVRDFLPALRDMVEERERLIREINNKTSKELYPGEAARIGKFVTYGHSLLLKAPDSIGSDDVREFIARFIMFDIIHSIAVEAQNIK